MANCIVIENDFGVWSLDRLVTSYNSMLTCHSGSVIEDGFWFYKDKSRVTSYNLQLVTIHEPQLIVIQDDFGV
jgi:hypothetical protein